MRQPSPLAPPTVVVVEDDQHLLQSLKFAFEVEGFSVRDYESAEAMLAAGAPPEGACLVLDYRLPGMDALSLLRSLRAAGHDQPALLITTPNAETSRRAALSGVSIVEKPLAPGALVDGVRQLLHLDQTPT